MVVCRTNISKPGQVCLKFRNNPSLALNCLDQAGPYTALRMPRSGEFSTVALFVNERLFCRFFYDISKNYETMDQHLLKRLH